MMQTIPAWWALAVLCAKASVLLLAAALLVNLLRGASAATRHLIWTLGLAGALALPLLSPALPAWTLAVPGIGPALVGSPVPAAAAVEAALPAPSRTLSALEPAAPAPSAVSQTSPASSPDTGGPADVSNAAAGGARDLPLLPRLAGLDWQSAALLLWLAGAVLVLGRLVAGIAAVQWLSRRTERVRDAPWLTLARGLERELGLRVPVTYLQSRRATMPMAWGLVRPTVLMPADADGWPHDRLRIVLLHELAHVKRRDCLTHALAQVACAAHWFNPLAWMAARRARAEREHACDDLVLSAGTGGAAYAEELLEIARGMRAGRFPGIVLGATLAMAHRSQLEGRLMAILDPRQPRGGLTRVRALSLCVLFCLALVPLAALEPRADAEEAAVKDLGAQQLPTVPVPVSGHVVAHADQRGAVTAKPALQAGSAVKPAQTVPPTPAAPAPPELPASAVPVVAAQAPATPAPTPTPTPTPTPKTAPTPVLAGADQDEHRPVDPRAVAALTAAMGDSDAEVRETVIQALVRMRAPAAYDPLVKALSDPNPSIREQAAFGLGQLRDKRAAGPLAAALKDANKEVREQAVFALGQLHDPATVDALLTALKDADAGVRQQAAFALAQLRDPKAVAPLVSALKDSSPDVREQAAFGLAQLRDRSAVEGLVVALKDESEDVRGLAAFALGQLRDPRAIEPLTALLKDPSADVRQQAAFALGQVAR
jgi:HEAT repeat protein/beta-lactamase regulating signal transducer with metallopeptidase domain